MPEAWRRYEYSLADSFNGQRVPLSGAGAMKLDVDQFYFRIEAKSANRRTPTKFSVSRYILKPASDGARRDGKRPLLAVLLDGFSCCWMIYDDFQYICGGAGIVVPGPMIYMRTVKGTKLLGNLPVRQSDFEEIEKLPHQVAFEMLPVLAFTDWGIVLVGMKEERLVTLMRKGDLM